METELKVAQRTMLEIWHKEFNLEGRDNLSFLPQEKGVFAVLAMVGTSPANCRYVAAAGNIRDAITDLFEGTGGVGMKKFMQGPWYKVSLYRVMAEATGEELKAEAEKWISELKPAILNDGEYPGYYD